jgi:hypothetical protein
VTLFLQKVTLFSPIKNGTKSGRISRRQSKATGEEINTLNAAPTLNIPLFPLSPPRALLPLQKIVKP